MTQVAAVGGMVSGEQERNLPGRLDQYLVLLTFQNLKVHDNNLETQNYCVKNTNKPRCTIVEVNNTALQSAFQSGLNSPCVDA